MVPSLYTLPSNPSLHVEDRFGILDSDELTVPFWSLFSALLDQDIRSPKALIDLLETIAVLLRGTSDTDYGFLRSYLEKNIAEEFWSATWLVLRRFALDMPILFPTHSIPVLSPANPRLVLSRSQTACLVIHQFLCTIPDPVWQQGFHDFDLWYGSQQPHPRAVRAYLSALFTYFKRLDGSPETSLARYTKEEWSIIYELVEDVSGFDQTVATDKLRNVEMLRLSEATTAPAVLGLANGAAVVSANKYIGFGCTGTQEETHIGSSPEACPAVLVTPPLQDNQVLVVTGVEAMISIDGYGRDARCGSVLKPVKDQIAYQKQWATRTMIFMDALELDLSERNPGILADLQPGNVERELKKAYIGFKHRHSTSLSKEAPKIFTGFWGCGTFGGNPEIKACIQWCAASLAGCDLIFVCSSEQQHQFADQFEALVSKLHEKNISANDLRFVLLSLQSEDIKSGCPPFMSIINRLLIGENYR